MKSAATSPKSSEVSAKTFAKSSSILVGCFSEEAKCCAEEINETHWKSSYTHLGKIRNTDEGVGVIRIDIVKVCRERSEEDDVYFDVDVGEMVVRRSGDIEPNG